MILAILFAFTYAMVFHSVTTSHYNVRGAIIVLLILGAFFSNLKITVFSGFSTNVSPFWYSAAIVCQILLAMESGFRFTLKNTVLTVKWLIFIQINVAILSALPDITATASIPIVVFLVSKNAIFSIFSSYTSFVVCSGVAAIVVVQMEEKFSRLVVFMSAVVISQIFSSATFYTVAFAKDPRFWEIAITGTLLKILLSAAYIPAIYVVRHERMQERHS